MNQKVMVVAIGVLNFLGLTTQAVAAGQAVQQRHGDEAVIQGVLSSLSGAGARAECGSTCEKACRKKCVYR